MSVDTKLQQFILNVLNEEQYNSITNKDANQLYFTDYIEYYTKEETNNILPLFRGSFDDWSSVPVSASNYTFDFLGSSTPTQNDFILVKNYETRSYDILDYVESTGSQYINLGIVPTAGKTYELTFEPTSNLTGTLFGTNKTDIYSTPTTNGHSIAVNIGNTEGLNEIGNLVSEVYTITINATSINSNLGNITLKNPYSGDLPNTEMYLGALNNNGTASNFAPCKYKGFKVLQDGILENEYVPAIRTSDNAIGFLDKVSNVFYENLGDNPFVAGEVISSIGSDVSESGSWVCIYNGDWTTNGKGGWTPAFALVSSGGGSMPTRYVEAINGMTGDVVLSASDVGAYTTAEVDDLLSNTGGGGSGLQMFDTVLKDHILTFEESKGLALQGTYVYKEAVAGSRYGYADFYNKCLEEYNEATELPWEQPILTANGTLGGDSFAVSASSSYTGFSAWAPFGINAGASSNDAWLSNTPNAEYTMYFPIGAKISNITVHNRNSSEYVRQISSGTIYVSNDNSSWQELMTFTNTNSTASGVWDIELNASNYYKYYKLVLVGDGEYVSFGKLEIIATQPILQHSNGHIFYDISAKDAIDEIFNSTGMAWMYGVDTENERIYLPRNNWFEQLTADGLEVGKSVEAGLPNIIGNITPSVQYSAEWPSNGAFQTTAGATTEWTAMSSLSRTNPIINFNASRSNPIYGNSDTVQPNAVKKLLYICVGNTETVSAVTDITEVTTTENDTLPLLHHIPSDELLGNPSWLRSAGQWNDGNVYTTVYEYLVAQYVNGAEHTDTLKGSDGTEYTVTYKTVKGKKVVDVTNVGQVDAVYSAIGSAWYYVINQDDMTFRLPMSHNTECYTSDPTRLGLDVSAGLPNITGKLNWNTGTEGTNGNGVFNVTTSSNSYAAHAAGTQNSNTTITLDASRANPIYGNSDTVTPPHTEFYLYFKVANAVQNLELLDAGKILEAVSNTGGQLTNELATKANTDLSNCTKPYIVETYVNGNSGYVLYSDGLKHQWGLLYHTGNTRDYTITFLKPFTTANYNVSGSWSAVAKVGDKGLMWSVTNRATNTMIIKGDTGSSNSQNANIYWSAIGY